MSGVLNIFLALTDDSSSDGGYPFTITVADSGGPPYGWDEFGTVQGAIVPNPFEIPVLGENMHIQAINDYGGGSGIEVYLTDVEGAPLQSPTWTDTPFLRLGYSGGTLVLDTRDTGIGGDLDEGSSGKGAGFLYYWFPNVGGTWTIADVGIDYACSMDTVDV